jgi:hypothetical protein
MHLMDLTIMKIPENKDTLGMTEFTHQKKAGM